MILIIPEETFSPFNEDIERLQTNLRGFALDIENLQERVQSGDVTEAETRKVLARVVCAHFCPVICAGRKQQKDGRLRG